MRVPASLPILGGLDIGHIHEHKVVPFGGPTTCMPTQSYFTDGDDTIGKTCATIKPAKLYNNYVASSPPGDDEIHC
jgi:hypothetical protein